MCFLVDRTYFLVDRMCFFVDGMRSLRWRDALPCWQDMFFGWRDMLIGWQDVLIGWQDVLIAWQRRLLLIQHTISAFYGKNQEFTLNVHKITDNLLINDLAEIVRTFAYRANNMDLIQKSEHYHWFTVFALQFKTAFRLLNNHFDSSYHQESTHFPHFFEVAFAKAILSADWYDGVE